MSFSASSSSPSRIFGALALLHLARSPGPRRRSTSCAASGPCRRAGSGRGSPCRASRRWRARRGRPWPWRRRGGGRPSRRPCRVRDSSSSRSRSGRRSAAGRTRRCRSTRELSPSSDLSSPSVKSNVLLLGELVAPDELVALHLLVADRAERLLLDAVAALAVQHVERDALRGRGGVELDRDRDQSKRDRPSTDGMRRHRASSCLRGTLAGFPRPPIWGGPSFRGLCTIARRDL